MQLPDGTDLRQVTVLSKGDWERIQQQLYRKQIEEERLQKMIREREERKAKSKEVVQHWGNTIAVSIYEPRSEKTGLRGFRPGPT